MALVVWDQTRSMAPVMTVMMARGDWDSIVWEAGTGELRQFVLLLGRALQLPKTRTAADLGIQHTQKNCQHLVKMFLENVQEHLQAFQFPSLDKVGRNR